jgi:hypothetical protein
VAGCSSSAGTSPDASGLGCSADTPGVVACGVAATPCRIERCQAQRLDADMFPPRYALETCLPDAGELPGGETLTRCDGPEDCPAGEQCWQGEFQVGCNVNGVAGYGPYCHADCDCPSGLHCRPCQGGVGNCCD